MKQKKYILLLFLQCKQFSDDSSKVTIKGIPTKLTQMIFVVGDSWDSLKANLYLCELSENKWHTTKFKFPAVIGNRGMGIWYP